MQVIEKNGIIRFILEGNESENTVAQHQLLATCQIRRQGAGIEVLSADNTLLLYFKPYDNTILICDPTAYDIAAVFGTKRFPIGSARQQDLRAGVTEYPRDIHFASYTTETELMALELSSLTVKTLPQLLATYNNTEQDQLYSQLSGLFRDHANFTPAKQQEYNTLPKEDKFCRFNADNQQVSSTIRTEHVFLFTSDNQLAGTCSATLILHPDKNVDVYVYDEVVVNPAHLYVLFTAMRQQIQSAITNMTDRLEGVSAFIRAAAGSEDKYKLFNPTINRPPVQVLHDPATDFAKALDQHIKKTWAERQLQQLTFSNAAAISSQRYTSVTAAAITPIEAPALRPQP